ncbi:Rrf2 family transcriptional regulator [Belnapia sp. T6]|uniref:Rrf2 family transcriptional regulator n=1 Tax=Belnapia mucosa TaxID=2804532 RepID=A0ABS1V2B7_9PROT|nr:Rrf2 family transcriptional regulator [Belnapia mucosa]MBL6455829.1 Rrf2 family transcriptional regulator [Belnapia mucosa]
MRLTLYTDYALRTLIYLGLRSDRRVSIREVAAAHRISENHLVKVVHQLGRGGFVETTRGKGGGLRLARAPETIRIGDVVRFTEEDMALVACFEGAEGSGCALVNACRLQSLLGEALGAFLAVLDRHTLADLLARPNREVMAERLGLGLAGAEPQELATGGAATA